jgi:hypothetical protein
LASISIQAQKDFDLIQKDIVSHDTYCVSEYELLRPRQVLNGAIAAA